VLSSLDEFFGDVFSNAASCLECWLTTDARWVELAMAGDEDTYTHDSNVLHVIFGAMRLVFSILLCHVESDDLLSRGYALTLDEWWL